jgi:hypothetical protein
VGQQVASSGHVETAVLSLNEFAATDLAADWRGAGKACEVTRLEAHSLGGAVTAQGWLATGGAQPAFYFRGRAAGVQLASLPRVRRPISGTASGEFVLQGSPDAPRASGTLHLDNPALEQYRVERADARWNYADGCVTLSEAQVDDPRGTARLFGTVNLDGALDLRLDARLPSLIALAADLGADGLDGQARLEAHLTGTTEALRVAGHARLDGPRWNDAALDALEGDFAWSANRLVLTALRAYQLPAVATAHAIELARTPEGKFMVQGTAELGSLSLAGLARLAGVGEWLRREPVAGRLTRLRAEFAGPLNALRLNFAGQADGVALRGLALGTVEAHGSLDLATHLARLDALTATHADQRIQLAGTLALPERGRAEERKSGGAGTPGYPRVPTKWVMGWWVEAPDKLVRSSTLPLFPSSTLSLSLSASHLAVLPLIRRFAPRVFDYLDLSGTVEDLHVQVAGTPEAPRLAGDVHTSPLVINGEGFQPAAAQFSYRPEVVTLAGLTLAADQGGRLQIPALAWLPGSQPGRTAEELLRQVAGSLSITDLPLRVARSLIGESPSAQASAGEAVAQWLARVRPDLEGKLQVTATCAAPVPVRGDWDDAAVAQVAAFRREHPAVALDLSVPDFSLVALPASEEGIDASLRSIHVRVETHLTYRPGRLDLDSLLIDQLGGNARLTASGWREIDAGHRGGPSRVQLDLDAVNIPLTSVSRLPLPQLHETLRPWMPVQGLAELHATATGDARAPNVQASVSVDNLVVRGLKFSELKVGQVEIAADEGKLHLFDVDLVERHPEAAGKHDHRLRLEGELPFSWSLPGIVPDRPRDLTITMADQPLDFLNELLAAAGGPGTPAPLAGLGVTEGRVAAEVHLRGTALHPENTGTVRLDGGRVHLGALDTAVENLQALFRFSGNEVRVERFAGGSSRTGGFQVTGRATLGLEAGTVPQLDLALEVNQFRFIEEHLERFSPALRGTTVRGTLQTVERDTGRDPKAIRITGPWTHPRITGALRLANANTGIPTAASPPHATHLPVDPELDLRLFAGDEVAIRNAFVDMRLGGSLAVSNTLSAPVVTGRLTVRRGTLQLPTMRFRMDGLMRVAYDGRPLAAGAVPPPPLFVDLTGTTHLAWRQSPSLPVENVEVVMTVRGSPTGAEFADGRAAALSSSLPGRLLLGEGDGLSIDFRSDPPLPAGQLASLIRQQLGVEGIFTNETNLQAVLRSQVQLALANTVAPLLTSRIEDYLQQALGLDILTIEVGNAEQPLQLRVGKRLLGGLYGTFGQQVGSANNDSRRTWELYYRMSPRLRLGFRQEDPSNRRLFFLSGSLRFR